MRVICLYFRKVSLTSRHINLSRFEQNDSAPSEDSDQPGHTPSLIRIFAVHMKKALVLSYPLSASEDSDQTGQMPRLI